MRTMWSKIFAEKALFSLNIVDIPQFIICYQIIQLRESGNRALERLQLYPFKKKRYFATQACELKALPYFSLSISLILLTGFNYLTKGLNHPQKRVLNPPKCSVCPYLVFPYLEVNMC